jgi:RimJ/RimL family protein N-acetyltransferase
MTTAELEMHTDPILLNIPESIETQRMTLRCPRAGDGRAIYEATVESIDALRPWMPWVREELSVERSEKSVRVALAKWILREDLRFSMHDKHTGRFIGGTGLHRPSWDDGRFEIGYWIRSSEANNGYVTEAVRALTDWTFDVLQAQRIEIRMDARNERSWRVAERAGYTLEGELVKDRRALDGVQSNTRIYARVQSLGQ